MSSQNEISKKKQISVNEMSSASNLLMKVLVNKKNFKTIESCEQDIPTTPGLYCIRIKDPKVLDSVFFNVLTKRNHSIMYIGIASKSLRKRFLNQELKAKGHGTFFRSLGAILSYSPERGSLVGMRNQNNYKFSPKYQEAIIEWTIKNLVVNWVELDSNLNDIENELLRTYLPLLNLAGNPGKLKEIIELRDNCKMIARGEY